MGGTAYGRLSWLFSVGRGKDKMGEEGHIRLEWGLEG